MLIAIKLAIPPEKTTNTKLESAIIYQNTFGAQVLFQMKPKGIVSEKKLLRVRISLFQYS